jgi:Protein NO VEIN, C-terminal
MTPRERIANKTLNEIESFLSTVGKSDIYESTCNLSRSVSDDYGDRFLIELLQNAHDAHPPDTRSGEISILLQEEDGSGCLYVANRGQGFTPENFRSICNIALSSKPINEGIGNKGLGFQSVLQVCQWPEVYSATGEGRQDGKLDGYCFRFATDDDLRQITRETGVEAQFEAIATKIPRLSLPVEATHRPEAVEAFARQGFVTVVRLPLDSPAAYQTASNQLKWILSLDTPVQLFLGRISRITVFDRRHEEPTCLTRDVRSQWSLDDRAIAQQVSLSTGGDYLVFEQELEAESFKATLTRCVAARELPESWLNWKGAAKIAIAVRLGGEPEHGRLYSFLPLGREAISPFSGHLNANFYTHMDRRTIHEDCSLNSFFVEAAAILCRKAIQFVISKNWTSSPGAVVDLLCWQSPRTDLISNAYQASGNPVVKNPVMPCIRNEGGWGWETPNEVFCWEDNGRSCLSAEMIARSAGAKLLMPGLGQKRVQRVLQFLTGIGHNPKPGPSVVADWVADVAKTLLATSATPEQWASFYEELATIFQAEPLLLRGKKILLGSSDQLLTADDTPTDRRKRRLADIYFSPVVGQDSGEEGDDTTPIPVQDLPETLKDSFAFLHPKLLWNDADRRKTKARFFLEQHFVLDYRKEDILRTLGEVTRDDARDQKVRLDALEWAFRVWSSGRALSDIEVAAARFKVPTQIGWTPATDAMFGDGWKDLQGAELERFMRRAGSDSPALMQACRRLIPTFDNWPIRVGEENGWRAFLMAAGIVDHLRPWSLGEVTDSVQGASLAYRIEHTANLEGNTKTLWRLRLGPKATNIPNPYTDYGCNTPVWSVPGQEDHTPLTVEVKIQFARQLLRMVPKLDESHWALRIFRPRRYGKDMNPQAWPTPLDAFLAEAPWIPVKRSGGETRFVRPREAWFYKREAGEIAPRFLDLVESSCAEIIERDPRTLEALRTRLDLAVLNDPRDSSRAVAFLANLALKGELSERDSKSFREHFASAWDDMLAKLGQGETPTLPAIPVSKGRDITAIAGAREENSGTMEDAYYLDTEDRLKEHLAHGLGIAVFDFHVKDRERTWNVLSTFRPAVFQRLSQIKVEALADGEVFEPDGDVPMAREVLGDWVADFLVCAAEFRGGDFFTRTQKTLDNLRRSINRLRLKRVDRLEVRFGGQTERLPSFLRGSVFLDRPGRPTLLVEHSGDITWAFLQQISQPLAEAVQQRVLSAAFEVAFLRLANVVGGLLAQQPSAEEVARALDTDVGHVQRLRSDMQSSVEQLVFVLRPVAHYAGKLDVDQKLEHIAEAQASETLLIEALAPLRGVLGREPQVLLDLARQNSDVSSLRSALGLDLGRFNEALRQLGHPYAPINHREDHERAFKARIEQLRPKIFDALRARFLDDFNARQPLDRYIELRTLASLVPDPSWYECYDELPEILVNQRANAWLNSIGATNLQGTSEMPALADVREQNRQTLREFAERYRLLVAAWVRKRQGPLTVSPDPWHNGLELKQRLIEIGTSAGWIDFVPLDDRAIAAWLATQGHWPDGMPVTTELAALGLTEEDAARDEKNSVNEKSERQRRRTTIQFAGLELSALEEGYQDLVAAVRAQLENADKLLNSPDRPIGLEEIEESKGRTGVDRIRGGGGGKGALETRLSDDQKNAIGLVGELLAREWLKRVYRERYAIELSDESWVSGNRDKALATKVGQDGLGYDFRIELKTTTHYFEVKASSGDPAAVEMGPTEIATAQRYRHDEKHRYRILYIPNVLEPSEARVFVLPNPFSKTGEKYLSMVGDTGIRYRFVRKED